MKIRIHNSLKKKKGGLVKFYFLKFISLFGEQSDEAEESNT